MLGSALALIAVFLTPVLPATAHADGPAPSVSLDSYPEYAAAHTVSFTGTAAHENSPVASVEYRVDDGPWLPAAPVDGAFGGSAVEPYTFIAGDLDDGWHQADVKATTKAGYTTAADDYAVAVFCVDTVPPMISIVPLSPDASADNTPTVTGSAQDSTSHIAAVEFRLDGAQWSVAAAVDGAFDSLSEGYSFTTAALADGPHTVQARARDAAGNVSAPVADTFAIDTTAPSLALEPLPAYIGASNVILHGTAADAGSLAAAVEGSLDGGQWTAASSPDGAFDEPVEEFAVAFSGLSDGSHTVELRSADVLGNSTAAAGYLSASFVTDTTAPSVLLLPAGSSVTSDSTPGFSGSASDATSPIVLVQYELDGGHWIAAAAADGLFDEPDEDIIFTVTELSDGAHSVELMATDAAGNVSALTGQSFTVDTAPPSVTIEDVPDLVGLLSAVSGTASDAPPGQIARVQVAIGRGSDRACWDGSAWVQAERWLDGQGTDTWICALPALDDGQAYQIRAVSVDTAGNLSREAVERFTAATVTPDGDAPPSTPDPPAAPEGPDVPGGETPSRSPFFPWWWLLATGLAISGLTAIALLTRARKGRSAS